MDKGTVREVFTQMVVDYSVSGHTALVFGDPGEGRAAIAIREGKEPDAFYTIILREPVVEHLVHELAHVIEWFIYGDSSNHEYRWMEIYEELEEKYVKN